ncbi:deoxycytidylate deaminase [Methylocystis hirsuta]|uniref:CMP/dCMP-type deaminase domain-containing protein n=1 Tax=Methylocystis hirsuta TaxID=369798 RepID=A0A3M9XMB8_9HYPH|nr:deaminase [Methylocystis hirsuta]RNJ49427.1 hypothetical protein D1O30_07225 [Methylocystis hirsuta]
MLTHNIASLSLPPSKWDRYFFNLAHVSAQMSKDPSSKCGSVIVRPNNTVASMGWNGFPRGVNDAPELYADRNEKYPRVVHAEMNAILAAREPLTGYSLYVTPMPPCARCASAIIQSGISRVAFLAPAEIPDRWCDEMRITAEMFEQADIRFVWLGYPNVEMEQAA